ncbi:hypothetical protein L289_1334 [Acinetobacter gerneri DSM 14967 = CIP 107464 = MTCC 9824]|nr:hypothetical protein L289_1334 [Acinetobacter gerneri DSM 14967 = CIP 107464 = MTCC 9824]
MWLLVSFCFIFRAYPSFITLTLNLFKKPSYQIKIFRLI